MAAAAGIAIFAGDYLMSLASERVLLRLRDALFAHAQRLPPDFFDRRRLGDLMVRLTDDVTAIEGLVASGLVGVISSAVSVVMFAAATAYLSWELALVAVLARPLFLLVSRAFAGPLRAAAATERQATGSVMSAVEESLSSQALVQAFNRQPEQASRLHREGVGWLQARMAEARLNALHAPVAYLTETLCVLAVFGCGAWLLSVGRISLGGLLSFAILLAYLYPPIQSLAGTPRAAGAYEFIAALPGGYATQVGQRGRLLSGGQRQRIAIARAILRDAPVLVLDEPTTALDAASARHTLHLLAPLMANRTTILITHDSALARQADDILVLGTPAQLAAPAANPSAR